MSKQKYNIEITASAKDAIKAFKSVSKSGDKLAGSMKGNGKSMSQVFNLMKTGPLGAVGAVAGLTAAFVGLSATIAANVRESANFARMSDLSIGAFKALDFAAKQYGMTGEQVADITKDITDKAQEFARDATGPFMDFANELNLTEEQAKSLAGEMVHMSGPESMGLMVSMMEDAGLTSKEMTQALESMGNDLAKLTPLFADQSSELERLENRFGTLTNELDDSEVKLYTDFAESIDLVTSSLFSMLENALLPALAPMTELADATAHFFATMNSGTEAARYERLAEIRTEISELETEIDNNSSAWGRFKNSVTMTSTDSKILKDDLEKLRKEYESLNESLGLAAPKPKLKPEGEKETKTKTKTTVEVKTKFKSTLDDRKAADKLGESLSMAISTPVEKAKATFAKNMEVINKAYEKGSAKHTELEILAQERRDEAIRKSNEKLAKNALVFKAKLAGDEEALSEHIYQQKLEKAREYFTDKNELEEVERMLEEERNAEKTAKVIEDSNLAKERLTANASGQLDFDTRIKDKESALQVKFGQDMLGEMAKESKAAFQVQKGLRIANAIMNTYEMATGAFNAMASIPFVGPALGAAAAAAAVVFGMKQVKTIREQEFKGQADKGIDSVPIGGNSTWVLKHGERVVQPEANKKLTKYLDDQDKPNKKNVDFNYNFTINGNVTDEEWFNDKLAEHQDFIAQQVLETIVNG